MAPEPWCIYIDVEGFSALLDKDHVRAYRALGEMMRAIFRIGRYCYAPLSPDLLCAYQFGDGFVIMSDWHEQSLDRCVAVAGAIMCHVAGASGCYTRAAIAEGELADIQGCYPDEVMQEMKDGCKIWLREGLMVITSVIGEGLTRTYGLAGKGKPASSGPLLIISECDATRVDASVPRSLIPGPDGLVSIDWVHMKSELLSAIQQQAGLEAPSLADIEVSLASYCAEQPVKAEWVSVTTQ